MAVRQVNPQADLIGKNHALQINASAAQGLMNVLKSNLGPNGTIKVCGELDRNYDIVVHQILIEFFPLQQRDWMP